MLGPIAKHFNQSLRGIHSLVHGLPMQSLRRRRSPQGGLRLRHLLWRSGSRQNRARQIFGSICLARNVVRQSHPKRRFQPREQFHALQAAQPQVAVQLRRKAQHRQSALAAEFTEKCAENLQHALACGGGVELCRWGGHGSHRKPWLHWAKANTPPCCMPSQKGAFRREKKIRTTVAQTSVCRVVAMQAIVRKSPAITQLHGCISRNLLLICNQEVA